MSDYLKRILQAVLVQRRHRLYEERLAEQAVPHDVWLKGVLEQEGAEIAARKEKTGEGVQKAVWEVRRCFGEHPDCAIAYGDEDRYLKPGEGRTHSDNRSQYGQWEQGRGVPQPSAGRQ